MKKLLILAAGVAGYVAGARAGRERYEQIRQQSQKVWNSPTVQSGVDHATDAAKSAASAAGSAAAGAASNAGHKVTEAVVDAVRGDDDKEGDTAPAPAAPTSSAPTSPTDDQSAPVPGDLPASPAVTTPPTAGDILDEERDRP